MDSALTTVGLPVALAIIMFGLGLSLTVDDFRRIGREPKPVGIALALQILVLPLLCFGLVQALELDAILAVGMMLLAASPGGTTANLFSHLFHGDVALNITLTALNSVIAVVTLPLVVNLAVGAFDPIGADELGLQVAKTLQVFAIVLVPVALGMLVRRTRAAFADRADKPVRIASAVVLAAVIVGALLAERENIGDYLADIGVVAVLFCVASLALGYTVPRLLRREREAGGRVGLRGRRAQQHARHRRRSQRPGQREARRARSRLRRADVPAGAARRLRAAPAHAPTTPAGA